MKKMNKEMQHIARQLRDCWEGSPWYGRNAKALLADAATIDVFQQPHGQHSVLQLVWHMVTWKDFAISHLRNEDQQTLQAIESADWRPLDHNNKALWPEGLQQLYNRQEVLVALIQDQKDELLSRPVPGRSYDFRTLLQGVVQHDIYHLGQIAYIFKLLG